MGKACFFNLLAEWNGNLRVSDKKMIKLLNQGMQNYSKLRRLKLKKKNLKPIKIGCNYLTFEVRAVPVPAFHEWETADKKVSFFVWLSVAGAYLKAGFVGVVV